MNRSQEMHLEDLQTKRDRWLNFAAEHDSPSGVRALDQAEHYERLIVKFLEDFTIRS